MVTQKAIPARRAASSLPEVLPAAQPTKARTTAPKSPAKRSPGVSPELRQHMIRDAAYYLAERNGFEGDPDQHWLEAEAQIDRMLQPDSAES